MGRTEVTGMLGSSPEADSGSWQFREGTLKVFHRNQKTGARFENRCKVRLLLRKGGWKCAATHDFVDCFRSKRTNTPCT